MRNMEKPLAPHGLHRLTSGTHRQKTNGKSLRGNRAWNRGNFTTLTPWESCMNGFDKQSWNRLDRHISAWQWQALVKWESVNCKCM